MIRYTVCISHSDAYEVEAESESEAIAKANGLREAGAHPSWSCKSTDAAADGGDAPWDE